MSPSSATVDSLRMMWSLTRRSFSECCSRDRSMESRSPGVKPGNPAVTLDDVATGPRLTHEEHRKRPARVGPADGVRDADLARDRSVRDYGGSSHCKSGRLCAGLCQ